MESIVAASVMVKMHSLLSTLISHKAFLTLFLPSSWWGFVLLLKIEFVINGVEFTMYGYNWNRAYRQLWKPVFLTFFIIEVVSFCSIKGYPESVKFWHIYFLLVVSLWFALFNPVEDRLHRRLIPLVCGFIGGSALTTIGEFVVDIFVLVSGMKHFYVVYKDNVWKLFHFCFMTFFSLWFAEMALLSKFYSLHVILFSIVIVCLFGLARPTRYRFRFYQIYIILALRVFAAMFIAVYNSKESLFPTLPSFANLTKMIEEIAEKKQKAMTLEL